MEQKAHYPIVFWSVIKGVFRTPSKTSDKAFCEACSIHLKNQEITGFLMFQEGIEKAL